MWYTGSRSRAVCFLAFSKVTFSPYQSQSWNLVACQTLNLAMKYSFFSKHTLWGCTTIWVWIKANEANWSGGLFGMLLRFSVSQTKYIQKHTRPLWSSCYNKHRIQKLDSETWLFAGFPVKNAKLGHLSSEWKHLASSLVKDVLKASMCERPVWVYKPFGRLYYYFQVFCFDFFSYNIHINTNLVRH